MQQFGRYRGASGHAPDIVDLSLLADAVEKGLVIFGEQ